MRATIWKSCGSCNTENFVPGVRTYILFCVLPYNNKHYKCLCSQREDLAERHQLQEVVHTVFDGSTEFKCGRIDGQHCDVFSTEEASALIPSHEGFSVNYDHKEKWCGARPSGHQCLPQTSWLLMAGARDRHSDSRALRHQLQAVHEYSCFSYHSILSTYRHLRNFTLPYSW